MHMQRLNSQSIVPSAPPPYPHSTYSDTYSLPKQMMHGALHRAVIPVFTAESAHS